MHFKAALLALIALLGALPAAALTIRFYPSGPLYTYELARAQNASSLLVHNIAILNDGSAPVTLTSVDIELRAAGKMLDTRTLDAASLARSAASGAQMQQAGMIDALAFMFGGPQLLPAGTKLAATTTLQPGEALLLSTQLFAWRGARDELRVRAVAGATNTEGTLAISSGSSKTVFALPVKGVWSDAAGSSLHTAHRWVPMEQFAHDLIRFGPDQKSYKGAGTAFADYFAYGQPVIAGAAGTVIAATDGQAEDTAAMKRPDETIEAYFTRLQGDQMERVTKGVLAIVGNHVVIDHGNGEYSMYVHLKPGSVKVKPGQKVAQDEEIGQVGSSGNSTEPHLHFQVCNSPDPLMCAGIPPTWRSLATTWVDTPRAIQSGDPVYDLKTPN